METFARQIAEELEKANHCAVYDRELTRVWPNRERRETQLTSFARKHGFRLRFYKDGLCAIFDKDPIC